MDHDIFGLMVCSLCIMASCNLQFSIYAVQHTVGSVLGPMLFVLYTVDLILLWRIVAFSRACMLTTPRCAGHVIHLPSMPFLRE